MVNKPTNKPTYEELEKIVKELNHKISDLKISHEKIRKNEEKIRLVFDNMEQGFVLHEIITDSSGKPNDFRFLEINPVAEMITGFRESEIYGKKGSDIGAESMCIEQYGRVALSGESECFEKFNVKLNKWFDVVIYQPQYGQCIAIFTDITERKKKEAELQKISVDLMERMKELNCLYDISKIAEAKDLTIGSLMKQIVDIIPPAFQYPESTFVQASINNAVYKSKMFKKTKQKVSSPILLNNDHLGCLDIFLTKDMLILDEEKMLISAVCERVGKIIERILVNKKLREVESRYRLLTDQFADGITIIQNSEYKFVNKAFLVMVGYGAIKDLIGKKYHQFVAKDFIDQYSEDMTIINNIDDFQDTFEYKLVSETGLERWIEEKRNIIEWDFAPAVLCTLRDITEKKEKEASSTQETSQLRNENILLRSSLKERYRFHNIIGISPLMQRVYDQILTAANSDANISISGESGTGKELVAKAIHDLSKREANTFVTINCGAIPEPLMESEFFGYKKGAFTGAVIDKHGFLDLADNGTLFLDEIGEIPLSMQVKLLRAIDGGGYNPIGSHKKRLSNFRIVAATNRDLKEEVVKGNMREDFYYRVQVIPIHLPPLRKRKEDIPFLLEHFTRIFSKDSLFKKIPDYAISQIVNYDWVGNVRELQNVLLRYFSTGEFELADLKNKKSQHKNDFRQEVIENVHNDLNNFIKKNEKEQIEKALQANNWHRTKASIQLGISRSTLFRKIKKYGLPLKQNDRI
jgi:PAS domain S-box-containing protein